MSQVSLKAVVIGVVVDFVWSTILAAGAALVWGFVSALNGTALPKDLAADPRVLALTMAIGLFTMGLGGFVAGLIAGRAHVLHGALVGAICLALGLLINSHNLPHWYMASGWVFGVPATIGGSVLARRGATSPEGNAVAGA